MADRALREGRQALEHRCRRYDRTLTNKPCCSYVRLASPRLAFAFAFAALHPTNIFFTNYPCRIICTACFVRAPTPSPTYKIPRLNVSAPIRFSVPRRQGARRTKFWEKGVHSGGIRGVFAGAAARSTEARRLGMPQGLSKRRMAINPPRTPPVCLLCVACHKLVPMVSAPLTATTYFSNLAVQKLILNKVFVY